MRQDRERVVERIALVSCLVLAPFLAYGLLQGRLLQASAGVVLLAALMADALALRRGASPPVPFPLLFLPILAAISVTVASQGIIGILWAYPALMSCHFVLSRRAFSLRWLGQDMRHAPRPWKTSPNFPGLDTELAAGAPMEHALFPLLWTAPD